MSKKRDFWTGTAQLNARTYLRLRQEVKDLCTFTETYSKITGPKWIEFLLYKSGNANVTLQDRIYKLNLLDKDQYLSLLTLISSSNDYRSILNDFVNGDLKL